MASELLPLSCGTAAPERHFNARKSALTVVLNGCHHKADADELDKSLNSFPEPRQC